LPTPRLDRGAVEPDELGAGRRPDGLTPEQTPKSTPRNSSRDRLNH
jgi:hypothetical protein